MKSPREALSRSLKSCLQLCITSVDFPPGTALQARLYMRKPHIGRTANFKLNSHKRAKLSDTNAPEILINDRECHAQGRITRCN